MIWSIQNTISEAHAYFHKNFHGNPNHKSPTDSKECRISMWSHSDHPKTSLSMYSIVVYSIALYSLSLPLCILTASTFARYCLATVSLQHCSRSIVYAQAQTLKQTFWMWHIFIWKTNMCIMWSRHKKMVTIFLNILTCVQWHEQTCIFVAWNNTTPLVNFLQYKFNAYRF